MIAAHSYPRCRRRHQCMQSAISSSRLACPAGRPGCSGPNSSPCSRRRSDRPRRTPAEQPPRLLRPTAAEGRSTCAEPAPHTPFPDPSFSRRFGRRLNPILAEGGGSDAAPSPGLKLGARRAAALACAAALICATVFGAARGGMEHWASSRGPGRSRGRMAPTHRDGPLSASGQANPKTGGLGRRRCARRRRPGGRRAGSEPAAAGKAGGGGRAVSPCPTRRTRVPSRAH